MQYEIKKASIDNIEEVSSLYDALNDYLESGQNFPRWKKDLYPVRQTAINAALDGTLFVLMRGEKIAGSVILNSVQEEAYHTLRWPVEANGEEVIVVRTLTVHPHFMGQGIAQALLSFAYSWAAKKEAKCLRLDVTVHNAPAIRLYEKMGYQRVGIVDLGLNIPGLEFFYCYELAVCMLKESSMNVRLQKPTVEMEAQYHDFALEWAQSGEEITPYSARLLGMHYPTWLSETAKIEDPATCPAHLVPAFTYFLIAEDGKILGAINIRTHLNDYLSRIGGHIGYGVRPAERQKGYASLMLSLALPIAKQLGMNKVLITCDRHNIASAKTILKNGGILENEVQEDGEVTQRYWITI